MSRKDKTLAKLSRTARARPNYSGHQSPLIWWTCWKLLLNNRFAGFAVHLFGCYYITNEWSNDFIFDCFYFGFKIIPRILAVINILQLAKISTLVQTFSTIKLRALCAVEIVPTALWNSTNINVVSIVFWGHSSSSCGTFLIERRSHSSPAMLRWLQNHPNRVSIYKVLNYRLHL